MYINKIEGEITPKRFPCLKKLALIGHFIAETKEFINVFTLYEANGKKLDIEQVPF